MLVRRTRICGHWEIEMRLLRIAPVGLLVVAVGLAGSTSLVALAPADSPLIDAVRRGALDAVRGILDETDNVDVRMGDGSTALQWAVHEQRPEMVDLLLEAGADVTSANRHGVSPVW